MRANNFTLAELLNRGEKREISNNLELLNINIKKNKKKTELVDFMAEFILSNPLHLLHLLPEKEVLKLQRMVQSPNHEVFVDSLFNVADDCITLIGLTDFDYDDKKNVEFIHTDLAEALATVIDDFVDNREERTTKYRQEQLIVGLLNLYGMLFHDQLAELAMKYDEQITKRELIRILDSSYLLKNAKAKASRGDVYFSPFAISSGLYVLEIDIRQDLQTADFTLEEVMAAGDTEIPLPPLASEQVNRFSAMLQQTKALNKNTNKWLSLLWMRANNDEYFKKYIHQIVYKNQGSKFPEWEKDKASLLKNLVDIMIETAGLMPQWKYKGHSLNDINKIQKANSDIQGKTKTGRNEPCPCGSGKKYKHCCGKK
ncbi:SEC-C metal-binding domain-containing protein [uncultured Bacteroides sp.]|uniref:SEC-C metal-binding domain-containing protein n=1 Tax=uncultured Bacteroides sp. TaxID=162156 RepID=UPI002AA5F05A|nr:SEC-C metal-binding domain-containing protein [uncultured Bacteroides sp.]